jgi:TfoX/Sxy family transcriptional regulator of competence genes
MAIDAGLLERVRDILSDRPRITEKRMFGGVAFLCGGNLFLGVRADRLMVRVGAERYEEALRLAHVRPMMHSGRGMTGFVFVDAAGLDEDSQLDSFVDWGLGVAAALPSKSVPPKRRRASASEVKPRKSKRPAR